jgi:hypothetical protein
MGVVVLLGMEICTHGGHLIIAGCHGRKASRLCVIILLVQGCGHWRLLVVQVVHDWESRICSIQVLLLLLLPL